MRITIDIDDARPCSAERTEDRPQIGADSTCGIRFEVRPKDSDEEIRKQVAEQLERLLRSRPWWW